MPSSSLGGGGIVLPSAAGEVREDLNPGSMHTLPVDPRIPRLENMVRVVEHPMTTELTILLDLYKAREAQHQLLYETLTRGLVAARDALLQSPLSPRGGMPEELRRALALVPTADLAHLRNATQTILELQQELTNTVIGEVPGQGDFTAIRRSSFLLMLSMALNYALEQQTPMAFHLQSHIGALIALLDADERTTLASQLESTIRRARHSGKPTGNSSFWVDMIAFLRQPLSSGEHPHG